MSSKKLTFYKNRPRQIAIKLGRILGRFFKHNVLYHNGALPTEKIKILVKSENLDLL